MATQEPSQSWVTDLAWRLSMEIFFEDHAPASQEALSKAFPNGIPDNVTAENFAQAKRDLDQAKKEFEAYKIKAAEERKKVKPNNPVSAQHQRAKRAPYNQSAEWWKKYFGEKRADTIAVAFISGTPPQIWIAVNVKARPHGYIDRQGRSSAPTAYGLRDGRLQVLIRRACEAFSEARECKVLLLEPSVPPTNAKENAERHAEMQIAKYAAERGYTADKIMVGVSKLACLGCREVMKRRGIAFLDKQVDREGWPLVDNDEADAVLGGKRVTNWLDPQTDAFGGVTAQAL